jgi:hypothetical protein
MHDELALTAAAPLKAAPPRAKLALLLATTVGACAPLRTVTPIKYKLLGYKKHVASQPEAKEEINIFETVPKRGVPSSRRHKRAHTYQRHGGHDLRDFV